MTPESLSYLGRIDPVLRQLMQQAGPCSLSPRTDRTPFESLVRAVASQQLHSRAAETILGRFIALFPRCKFPRPQDLEKIADSQLRAVGFSGSKAAAIRDIASKSLAGVVPTHRRLQTMPDEAIIERLTECRGVGRWTVEMLLMFKLGRPDVLPVDDFGVREGFRIAYGLERQPKPRELAEYGERWRPHRSTAAWYMWRAVDLHRRAVGHREGVGKASAESSKDFGLIRAAVN